MLAVLQGSYLRSFCFFSYARVLFYADDMKLFLPVHGFRKIQSDLNKLAESCKANELELNVFK
jgi:hypothetical protein